MNRKPLETIETLAARMGLPARTVVREVDRCRLPYVSIAGEWRFRERDIEVWLDRAGPLPRLRAVEGEQNPSKQPGPSYRYRQSDNAS